MQIRKKDYSDLLVEGYLVESLYTPILGTSQEQKAAEEEYLKELKNGPKQRVVYANGQSYMTNIGSFDLDNFHKAYDQYYNDNNLIDTLFTSNGTLINRSTYGVIKNLDLKEPAVKALLKLWGTQFKQDMDFTTEKLQKQAAQQAAQQAQAAEAAARQALEAKINDYKAKIETEIDSLMQNNSEWTSLKATYQKTILDNIDYKINVSIYRDASGFSYCEVVPTGIYLPDKSSFRGNSKNSNIADEAVKIDFKKLLPNKTPEELIDMLDNATDRAAIDDLITKNLKTISKMAKLSSVLVNNAEAFHASIKNAATDIVALETSNILVYKNKLNNKYYKLSFIPFSNTIENKNGLLLIDLENNADRGTLFDTSYMQPAFCSHVLSDYGNSLRGYWHSETDYFYNSFVPLAVLEKNRIPINPQNGDLSGTPTIEIMAMSNAPQGIKERYGELFDTYVKSISDQDSGD